MGRLIDADDVIQRIADMDIPQAYQADTNLYLLGRVIGMIDNAPIIDTTKHGKWVEISEDGFPKDCCSVCGCEAYYDYDGDKYMHFDYCPNCGAKMEGD